MYSQSASLAGSLGAVAQPEKPPGLSPISEAVSRLQSEANEVTEAFKLLAKQLTPITAFPSENQGEPAHGKPVPIRGPLNSELHKIADQLEMLRTAMRFVMQHLEV